MMKKLVIILLIVFTAFCMLIPPVFADSVDESSTEKSYLVLGKDLTSTEKAKVLDNLGIQDESKYNVSYTTHQDEVDALSSYLPASVIGSRALSSVLMTKKASGSGISVYPDDNISYCTKEMYQNALITAGARDVDLRVTAPYRVSGTAALVAAEKSYTLLTGKKLSQDAKDAANQEIVTTQDVAKDTGDKAKAAELMAALKQDVAKQGTDYDRDKASDALDELCNKENVQLSDGTKEEVLDLMDKISKSGIDENTLKEQAGNIYSKIKGIDLSNSKGMLSQAGEAVKDFFQDIINFFRGK
jgi:uncharacterized protein YpuA (DUF1002 family)